MESPELAAYHRSLIEKFIDIPAGTRFVMVSKIPNLILKSTIPDEPPRLRGLHKELPPEQRAAYVDEMWRKLSAPSSFIDYRRDRDDRKYLDLTGDDWALLDDIWRGLPHVRDASPEQFEEYRGIFNDAPNKPDWNLHVVFYDYTEDVKKERTKHKPELIKMLNADIKSGKLHILNADHSKTKRRTRGAIVRVDVLREYLSKRTFQLREV